MPVYTVHGPVAATTGAVSPTEKYVFVRDGFHFWALVFGGVWLLWHRLWWATLGYVAIVTALALGLAWTGVGTELRIAVMILIAFFMGLEAASLRRWTLSRGKWRELDVVVAETEEAAERRFFDRWLAGGAGTRDAAPAPAFSSAPRAPGFAPGAVIGSFPESGGAR